MSITVNLHEAKAQFLRLLEQAHAGEEIIVAKAGKPYARIVAPAPVATRRQLGRLKKGRVDDAFFDPLPAEELAA